MTQADDGTVRPRSQVAFSRLGPFYRLQLRLGLLSGTDLAAPRRAVLFVGLAWIPAIFLAAMQGVALNAHHDEALLLDFSVYAYALAVGAFVLMEQTSDRRMAVLDRIGVDLRHGQRVRHLRRWHEDLLLHR